MTIILFAALFPPIFLMIRIYRMDKIEREPGGLILKLFLFGAVAAIAAGGLESIFEGVLRAVFYKNSLAYRLALYFLVVGWTEEGVKHFALKRGSWNHPAFDYRFDAVVYSVAAALGFAAFENVGYVFAYGLNVALGRALTAIPGHCIFGIFMGYYYGTAKHFAVRGEPERARLYQWVSILMPVLMHGFYDFCATSGNGAASGVFLLYVILLDIVAFTRIHRYEKEDRRIEA